MVGTQKFSSGTITALWLVHRDSVLEHLLFYGWHTDSVPEQLLFYGWCTQIPFRIICCSIVGTQIQSRNNYGSMVGTPRFSAGTFAVLWLVHTASVQEYLLFYGWYTHIQSRNNYCSMVGTPRFSFGTVAFLWLAHTDSVQEHLLFYGWYTQIHSRNIYSSGRNGTQKVLLA